MRLVLVLKKQKNMRHGIQIGNLHVIPSCVSMMRWVQIPKLGVVQWRDMPTGCGRFSSLKLARFEFSITSVHHKAQVAPKRLRRRGQQGAIHTLRLFQSLYRSRTGLVKEYGLRYFQPQ